jgi:polar amino acid transport system substrate-binding protein
MLKYHTFLGIVMGWCCLLMGVSPSLSQGTELLMVTLEHPPHSFESDGKVTGASTEMLQRILTRMGYKPVFQILPWQRAQVMIEEGKAAGIYTYTQTPERLAAAYYSNPVSFTSDVLFKRKDDAITWKTFADLRPYRVGASERYNYPKDFLEAAQQGVFTLEYVYGENANLQNLKKLKAHRIDLFICNPDVCGFIIKTKAPEFDDLDYAATLVAPLRTFHVGFSKKWPNSKEIRKEFNKIFDEFLKSGELQQIYDRYGIRLDYSKLGSNGANSLDKDAE